MKFTKMHGIGNDYVYMDCTREVLENPEELARLVSDRHKGIGADGLILIKPSELADFEMVGVRMVDDGQDLAGHDVFDLRAEVVDLLDLGAGHGKPCVILLGRDAGNIGIIRKPGKRQFHNGLALLYFKVRIPRTAARPRPLARIFMETAVRSTKNREHVSRFLCKPLSSAPKGARRSAEYSIETVVSIEEY